MRVTDFIAFITWILEPRGTWYDPRMSHRRVTGLPSMDPGTWNRGGARPKGFLGHGVVYPGIVIPSPEGIQDILGKLWTS